jgi:hypothetical protein
VARAADIERTMEDELRTAGLFPTVEQPIVDLEAFVERHLHVQMDQYAALDDRVLGQTEFYRDAAPRIMINRDLTGTAMHDEESGPRLRGRWRATVAHEACHVVLHRVLYEISDDQSDLFGSPQRVAQRLFRCMKDQVLFRGPVSDWREVQANRGMAALLMPRAVFQALAVEEIGRLQITEADRVAGGRGCRRLAVALSGRTGVSSQAASIRLETLSLVSTAGSPRLISS